ncbi:MAG: hypothetical protein ACOCPN_01035, partial [Desulfonatronovibrionaceae bacterium]
MDKLFRPDGAEILDEPACAPGIGFQGQRNNRDLSLSGQLDAYGIEFFRVNPRGKGKVWISNMGETSTA